MQQWLNNAFCDGICTENYYACHDNNDADDENDAYGNENTNDESNGNIKNNGNFNNNKGNQTPSPKDQHVIYDYKKSCSHMKCNYEQ